MERQDTKTSLNKINNILSSLLNINIGLLNICTIWILLILIPLQVSSKLLNLANLSFIFVKILLLSYLLIIFFIIIASVLNKQNKFIERRKLIIEEIKKEVIGDLKNGKRKR